MPMRIQRKRTKGWKMPDGAVFVGRPGMFGNPFRLEAVPLLGDPDDPVWALFYGNDRLDNFATRAEAAEEAVRLYRAGLKPRTIKAAVRRLRGRDLACWCALGSPCHADVLLELANAPICEEVP